MSWPQWSSGNQPAVPSVLNPSTPVINSAPAVVPPGLQYTPDQWAQLQQQNWHQWAQWQQQYQQWHQQYGAEYQKSINALAQVAQQPVAGLPNVAVPPPLPVETTKPPLPIEDPPPSTPSYTTVPPSQPKPVERIQNFPKNNQQNWQTQPRYDPNQNKRSFEQGNDQNPKRAMINRAGWQNQQAPPVQMQQPIRQPKENIEELSEAEKKFDKQFAEWEAQFNKWKEQNAEHPDKEQYREYEKKWETWRAQLLERREQMKRKRLGLTTESPNRSRPNPAQNFNQPPQQNFNQPQQPYAQPVQNYNQGNFHQPPPKVGQNVPPKSEGLLPTPQSSSFNKPPPNLNDEPLAFKQPKSFPEVEENVEDFIKPNTSGGIPGLDLVKDDAKLKNETEDVVVIDPENEKKGPDFDAISKGINTILGDQKLLNMLSMVSQNQNSKINDNLTNTVSKIKEASNQDPSQMPYPEQSNLSYEDHSNHSEAYGQREFVNNFDDQTRSSFTMANNEQEMRYDPSGGNFARPQQKFDPGQFPNRFDNFNKNNRFGGPENEQFKNNFGRSDFNNQFGPRPENTDRFPPKNDNMDRRYPQRNDERFAPNERPFGGPNHERFPFNKEKFGPNQNRYGGNQERFGPNQDRFDPNQDRFPPNQDRFPPNQERFTPNQERFTPNQERFPPNQERFPPNQDRFPPNQDRFGPAGDRFGPNDRFDSRQFGQRGDFRHGKEDFGGNFNDDRNFGPRGPPRGDGIKRQFSFGSDNFNRNQYDEYSQGNVNKGPPLEHFDEYARDASYDNQADFNRPMEQEHDMGESWKEQENYQESNYSEPPNVPPAPVEPDILQPTTVIDYEHKSLKNAEPEILIEPIHMFDYRHKPLSRIPLPQRPKWLTEAVRNIREFDPPVVRPYEPPGARRYPPPVDNWRKEPPPPVDNWRNERYQDDHWSSHTRRNYNENNRPPFEERRSYNDRYEDSKNFKKDWSPPEKKDEKKSFNQNQEGRKQSYISPIGNMEEENISDTEWQDEEEEPEKVEPKPPTVDFSKFHKPESSKTNTSKSTVLIEDLISPPGRYNRPPRIVIILRGPPGSGKTFLAKLIKDKEVENGGSTPRILSLDDYFMVEQEKEVTEDGKRVKIKEMVYEYEAEMEESYRTSLIKSFKKTITDGYFSFIIVDNVNDKVKYFGEMWSFAKQNGFQVYICQLDLDVQTCSKRNIHGRSESDIEMCVAAWEPTPSHHPVLDATSLLQSASIPEVEMEEVNSPESDIDDHDGSEDQVARSKWDNFDCSVDNLAKLDGVSKPLRASRTMEEYLQLDTEWTPLKPTKPGQKRVRWADLEEQKQQEKMRAIGFVVGQTNWDRMMDPTMGSSALTQTKYIERTGRYKVDQK